MCSGMHALLLLVVLVATPASAEHVLFFGDSMMNTGSSTRWPNLAMAATRDTYCVNSINGRNTAEGLVAIDSAVAACSSAVGGPVTDCVIGLAVADLLELENSTPRDTFSRLVQIADRCTAAGATPHLLTPPHAPVWGPFWFGYLNGETYTREVARLLRESSPYNVIDQRDRVGWKLDWNEHSRDGLHPTGQPLREVMAEPVIELFR